MRLILAAICMVILGLGDWAGAAPGKSVLIIQSYHGKLPWTGQCEEGIMAALGPDYHIRTFYMDTKRVPEAMFSQRAREAWQSFEELRPDLLMVGDDNGLRLLASRIEKTDTPVVYFGINHNPRKYFSGRHPANVTGVLERLPLFPWLRYLKQIMPGAKRVMVLMDNSPTSRSIVLRTFQNRDEIRILGALTGYRLTNDWKTWTDLVKGTDAHMIVMPTFHSLKKKDGGIVDYMDVIAWTSANAGVPLFSLQDYVVGPQGAAGAYTVFGRNHGRMAGELARQILEEGKSPRQLSPITDEQGQFFFNHRQLDRFGLTLPPGIAAQARFR